MRRFPISDTRAPRHGFTLVELLVSLALIVFIMSILSYAFQEATGVFRNMKAPEDMAEKLRAAMVLIRHDVSAYHFAGTDAVSATRTSGRRMVVPLWGVTSASGMAAQAFRYRTRVRNVLEGTGPRWLALVSLDETICWPAR